MNTLAYAAQSPSSALAPLLIERRTLGPHDVSIDILFCGVCHSDMHTARGEWPGVIYPSVPGHEIVGRVSAIGLEVTAFKVGDTVGVGCMVDSCQHCSACVEGIEQYCENTFTATYNGPEQGTGANTYGGYSERIVVSDKFVLKVSHSENLNAVAPLLCAGITMYSPLHHWGAGPGKKVGIVGLGGLGHMGVKLAHAMGAKVVVFTTSTNKIEDAKRLGADEVVVSKNPNEMAGHKQSFDLIIDAVAASHDLDAYLTLLKRDGTLVLVGVPSEPHPSPTVMELVSKRRHIAGSNIGGIAETQEMLDFCAAHGIVSDVEMIQIQQIENAYARMLKSDVKYRFVIDMASLSQEASTR